MLQGDGKEVTDVLIPNDTPSIRGTLLRSAKLDTTWNLHDNKYTFAIKYGMGNFLGCNTYI